MHWAIRAAMATLRGATITAQGMPASRALLARQLRTPSLVTSHTLRSSTALLSSAVAVSFHPQSLSTSSTLAAAPLKHTRSPSDRAALGVRCAATTASSDTETETFTYQAEVSRLMDLIVHSLYSHREVFLRELVSNASDALDKLRFLSVTEPQLVARGGEMAIRIRTDPEAGTITISDTGIGLTRQEAMDSLGTIAQSGTAKFLKAIKEKAAADADGAVDSNLIGQFGVGFYSAFLVADKVTVRSCSARSEAGETWVWEAAADSPTYTLRQETEEGRLVERGTSVELHLKDEFKAEYSAASRIAELVKNYSQFISFPIYTWQEQTRDKEEEYTEAAKEGEEPVTKTRTVQEKYFDWVLENDTKPIWVRSPKEVEKSEYSEFFKTTFKEFLDPLAYAHFNTEGEIEFRSLLFVPGMAPFDSNELFSGATRNIRLYVKRVFISDQFDGEMLPRYLSFIKGIVDSNDLPLNVSREILQESRVVRIMRKRLVRKVFDMLDDIAGRENKEDYTTFWQSFGRSLKLGCIEDSSSHARLGPLLRFFSSSSEEELTSLEAYVSRMKEGQKSIFYIAADTVKSAKSAPFLEKLRQKGLEVLFLVEPIDEVAVTSLASFKDYKFVDISKEELDLGDAADEAQQKAVEVSLQPLCDWIKARLGDQVAKVQVSQRIAESPCVLVAGKFGWSANMERIMKAQTMGDPQQVEFMRGRRILEINADHPIIKDLQVQTAANPESLQAKQMVELLYETAHIASGFTPDNPAEFGSRVYEIMALALGTAPTAGTSAAAPPPSPTPSPSPSGEAVSEAEVVEPSEVKLEGDVWK